VVSAVRKFFFRGQQYKYRMKQRICKGLRADYLALKKFYKKEKANGKA